MEKREHRITATDSNLTPPPTVDGAVRPTPFREDGGIDRRSSLSIAFSILKWCMILLVVANHFIRANDIGAGEVTYRLSENAILLLVSRFVHYFFTNNGAPVFMIISGYLFYSLGDFSFKTQKRRLKPKIKTLLYPYLLWNVIVILATVPIILVNVEATSLDDCWRILTDNYGEHPIGQLFYNGSYFPLNEPLWFIRDLLYCMLLTPLFVRALRRAEWLFLGALGLFYICCFDVITELWFCEPLLFYSLGLWLRMKGVHDFKLPAKIVVALLALYTGIVCYLWTHPLVPTPYYDMLENTSHIILAVVFMAAAHYVAEHVKPGGRVFAVIGFLASASFFVYLAHYPLMWHAKNRVFLLVQPQTQMAEALTLVMAYFALVTLLTAIYWLMWRHLPTLHRLLLGRRPRPGRSR